jgi:hypothetical protein
MPMRHQCNPKNGSAERKEPARLRCYNRDANREVKYAGGWPSLLPPAIVGEWLSLVEHLVRDQGVGGSNPLSPTIIFNSLYFISVFPITSL